MTLSSALPYFKSQRHFVDVGYLRDGIKRIVYPKVSSLEGDLEGLIEQLLSSQDEVIADVYKPNGSSKKFDRSLTITKGESLGALFQEPEPLQSKHNPDMESWKDYALQKEQEQNKKLEAELQALKLDNKSLDDKVREFEKEGMRKDYEIEKLTRTASEKSGLGSIITEISKSEESKAFINGILTKVLSSTSGATTSDKKPVLLDDMTEKYLSNIKDWLYKQTDEVQKKFYMLIVNVSRTRELESLIDQLINLTENGTTIRNDNQSAGEG